MDKIDQNKPIISVMAPDLTPEEIEKDFQEGAGHREPFASDITPDEMIGKMIKFGETIQEYEEKLEKNVSKFAVDEEKAKEYIPEMLNGFVEIAQEFTDALNVQVLDLKLRLDDM